jgi:alkaline phosphatase D
MQSCVRARHVRAPPDSIRYGVREIPNFRRAEPPQTILGAVQEQWFLERLQASRATWKIWGNTIGTLDYRADPQTLPKELSKPWPGSGYASLTSTDFGNAFVERGQIYDFVKDHGITGFVTVAGDRHAFWAGLAAKSLPPKSCEPVGIAFVTGSLSAPTLLGTARSSGVKANDPGWSNTSSRAVRNSPCSTAHRQPLDPTARP